MRADQPGGFMWAYASLGDRERRRAAMAANPGWAEFNHATGKLAPLRTQTTIILKPTIISPIRQSAGAGPDPAPIPPGFTRAPSRGKLPAMKSWTGRKLQMPNGIAPKPARAASGVGRPAPAMTLDRP